MAVSKESIDIVRRILKDRLSKSCEIRTYEIWYQTKREGVELDYKTVGNALRRIMDTEVYLGNVEKVKLGCWRVKKPKEPETVLPVHPSNVSKLSEEIQKKCALVRATTKLDDPMKTLDACAEHGVTLKTYLNYLQSCQKKKSIRP